MTKDTVCRHDTVQVFAGRNKIRDFIAAGTDDDKTVAHSVGY